MKTLLLFLTFALALLVRAQLPITSPARAGFEPARLEVLHASARRFVAEGQHAGVITLLARDGKLVDFQANGYRDLEKRLPMERDTICRVYSMSKIITSVGTLVLLEEGRFNLDDPVAKYLPELKEMTINTDVLGALIERVSGRTFGAFLQERIFRPLGMKDTGFDVPPEKMKLLRPVRDWLLSGAEVTRAGTAKASH